MWILLKSMVILDFFCVYFFCVLHPMDEEPVWLVVRWPEWYLMLNRTISIQSLPWKCSKCQLLSLVWLFATPWTVAHQALLSMELSRQEYWSGVLFPLQGIFPTLDWIEVSCIAGRFFTIWATREALSLP